ncbi:IS256 family transposase [Fictibacillus sp. Mic-4]|uniref:IS256 family transposase n=4 Tax=Fictibacillus TaxID=1329200 RepID=UPI003CFB211F
MNFSITDILSQNQLDQMVKDFLKEKIEFLLQEEIKNFIKVENPDQKLQRNGYYPRGLDTKYGRIEELSIPRDRQGQFHTQLFEPYERRHENWLEETIVRMYQSGMSTREVGKMVERLVGASYSAATVSNITEATMKDIEAWRKRPITKRFIALFLDALFVKVRRDTVDKEAVYIAMGITEDGHREILGFYVGGNESSTGWHDVLSDLYTRGLKQILLGVFDGLSGLEDTFRSVYPKADVQHCVVHKVRNTLNKARKKDQYELAEALKPIYKAPTKKIAIREFEAFKEAWKERYPKIVSSWEENLSTLLSFMDYPSEIRYAIYTTNWIERTNKEIRKRLKTMNSLTSIEAAEKIVYLTIVDMNDKWTERISTGFAKAKPSILQKFEEKYGK